ncbi:ankyrin repeat domain-containing protein 50 [Aspergillus udagawae]|nr:ankyrin repeat domain-containing protein 50 [Aspergillus udagawae]
MTRQHLCTLPVELVLEIAQYLSSPSLSALARTCHRAYDLLNPVLYSVPVNRLCSVLEWANCVGKQQTMHRLLDHNLSGVLKFKHLALWSACSAGSVEIVARLLDCGVPPDPPCDCHLTLSCVAGVNRRQIIMMLLSAGADLARYNFREVGELVSGWAQEDRGAPRALVQHGLDIRLVGSNGDNLLHRAVRQNLPTSDVIFLLDEGVDINHRNVDGRTPLAAAIADDDSSVTEKPDIVELLLQRGAKTDLPDNQSWHPLHHAASNAKPWAVRLLSQYGADPDARNSYGQTPLHLCCRASRCEEVIKALLDVGASPAAQASTALGEKRTPMYLALDRCFAARRGNRLRYLFDAWMAMSPALPSADVVFVAAAALGEVAVLQKLINSKTVNIEGVDGETTALMAAAAAGQDKVIELLLPRVANVDVADGIDHMALHHAVISGTETTIQLLLPRSSKVWASRNSRVLLITYAMCRRSPEVLRSLLEWRRHQYPQYEIHRDEVHEYLVDADIGDKARIMFEYMEPADLQPGAQKVPLMFFIREGYIDIALEIIQQGIGLEGRVGDWTPLRMAAAKGELAVVQALVNAGVDLEVRTDNNWGTALSLAIVNNHIEVAQCLLAAGANTDVPAGDPAGRSVADNRSALTWAVLWGSCDAVRLLLAHGAKEQLERNGKDALYWAMHDGRERIAALLVDAGAPVDEIDRYGHTILSQAASRGKTAIVRILLDAGVRVNLPDRHGRTPFLMAASRGHCEIARLLLEKGADTHQRDYFDRSALSLAADQGHDEMVRWLIEQGVDLNEGDRIGRTPLSWAMQMDSAGAVEALVLAGCDVLKPDHYGRTPLQWASSDACIAKLYCSFPGHRRGLRHRLQSGAEACHRAYTGLFCCGLMNRKE